jgi:ElaB/YqjD/DUF883 family membrane-anchored ribosome-binding protein
MTTLDQAQERIERALARLEAVLARRSATASGSEEGEELRRRCLALDAELQRISRDNQRLRDALAEAAAQMEEAASGIDELLGEH